MATDLHVQTGRSSQAARKQHKHKAGAKQEQVPDPAAAAEAASRAATALLAEKEQAAAAAQHAQQQQASKKARQKQRKQVSCAPGTRHTVLGNAAPIQHCISDSISVIADIHIWRQPSQEGALRQHSVL